MNQLAWPMASAIAGALVYAFAGNAKAAELGKILYFAGVLWTVYALSGRAVHF